MAMAILMPSAVTASEGELADKNVKAAASEKTAVQEARTIIGTVYDAATNLPMAGVRVQATGHRRITTMTDAEGKYKLNVPSYVTLLSFSTPEYLLVQRAIGGKDVVNVRLYSDKFQGNYSEDIVITAERSLSEEISTAITIESNPFASTAISI